MMSSINEIISLTLSTSIYRRKIISLFFKNLIHRLKDFMQLYQSMLHYNNREILLDSNFRLLSYILNDLGVPVTDSIISFKITTKKKFPVLSKIDIVYLLTSLQVKAISCKLSLDELVFYGNKSIVQIHGKGFSYAYVTKITDNSIEYFHPTKGNCCDSLYDFAQKWHGDAIVCHLPKMMYADENFLETKLIDKQRIDSYNNEILHITDFIEPINCREIIDYCEKNDLFNRSKVTDVYNNDEENYSRTSYSAFLNSIRTNSLFAPIIERTAKLTSKNRCDVVDLQCVRYSQGQEFKFHFDARDLDKERSFTLLVYLNDDYSGGETYFPIINYKITPTVGSAIFFKNLDKNNHPIVFSAHAGLPVDFGVKYALNIWLK